MSDLKSFLTKVAQDPSLNSQYAADPDGTMKAQGLSDADREAVLSGDRAQIGARLGLSPQAFGVSVNVTITLGISIP
ncbi:hypothetical protein GHK38_22725 [Sinorhizobium meliloti]|uniref:hypothetical protein n=1 Tax=Rhizobium meliloti TaxID=382 RepID=UPI0012979063|nr:hypothetical protein [Sinorhizobium meliloti]MDE3832008.1 hypothetical protein [Sinorhizobium meliloti]MDE4580292.1 hypothetical protein [Sinorhizobium meliloti]MQU70842.1 hypothetical protein [Sinorhizobium meliloti]MQV42346.1 hypothetical protein [Sinorhizobium meliloti]